MKNRVFAMFVGLAALTATGAFAQSGAVLKADIPFAFHVGSAILPAGHYEVRSAVGPDLMTIQCMDCKGAALVPVREVVADTKSSSGGLTFHLRGNAYFLSKVWAAGNSQVQMLP